MINSSFKPVVELNKNMKKNLKWRLSKLPDVDDLLELVKNKVITQEEARAILFSENEDRDKKSLQEEIKFLRDLVESLSKRDNTRIVEVIKEVESPWHKCPWYKPYKYWYTNGPSLTVDSNSFAGTSTSTYNTVTSISETNFSDIETF